MTRRCLAAAFIYSAIARRRSHVILNFGILNATSVDTIRGRATVDITYLNPLSWRKV